MVTLAGQLSIFDELEQESAPSRLGAGAELGRVLLAPLLLKGWRLHEPVRAFAGDGNLWILERDGLELRRVASTLGEIAVDLYEEACRITPIDVA